ncbi:hypothetical protein PM02_00805 [Sulfitobacter mediterraneus]|uniref:Uncharacterized protein n=1 Tax=Sulfitobacter mediterraneus TaxID=83219 RepID=A0A061STK1_9RHOB|nr:hypothetical protein PM02_00805 [Sulfitobacter mediterraneus]
MAIFILLSSLRSTWNAANRWVGQGVAAVFDSVLRPQEDWHSQSQGGGWPDHRQRTSENLIVDKVQ